MPSSLLVATRTTCRGCQSQDLTTFLELGEVPLAGGFFRPDTTDAEFALEERTPLSVAFCANCSLCQVREVVDPSAIFQRGYFYRSSQIRAISGFFTRFVTSEMRSLLSLAAPRSSPTDSKRPFVVEIGCNDGVLLEHFHKAGVETLGIDPASDLGETTDSKGLNVLHDFFGLGCAQRVVKRYHQADLILAFNVFAHIDDLYGVFAGVKTLLAPSGVLVFQVHYLPAMVAGLQFDWIYHEHASYFSMTAIVSICKRWGLEVFDFKIEDLMGGSIRVYIRHAGTNAVSASAVADTAPSVSVLLEKERELGICSLTYYTRFALGVRNVRSQLLGYLRGLAARGETPIFGYGASGRTVTLSQYCGLDGTIIKSIIDDAPSKQGCYTPGYHIPIHDSGILKAKQKQPIFVLLFAWSFADNIINNNTEFLENGGVFIVPLPSLKIVDKVYLTRSRPISGISDIPSTLVPAATSADKVLVIGGAGYLGSCLVARLLSKRIPVIVLDNLTVGTADVLELDHPLLTFVRGDVADLALLSWCMNQASATVYLAALVGDPACKEQPSEAWSSNINGLRSAVHLATQMSVKRFLFASSCSVYGAQEPGAPPLTESSAVAPVSHYGFMKVFGERILLQAMQDSPGFAPTVLRFATLHGLSKRMRFDLVVNAMSASAVRTGQVSIHGGTQWRPFMHTEDCAAIMMALLASPIEKVGGQTLNIGFNEENYTIQQIGEIVHKSVPGSTLKVTPNTDRRNYIVNFDKLHNILGDVCRVPENRVATSAMEMVTKLQDGQFQNHKSPSYHNFSSSLKRPSLFPGIGEGKIKIIVLGAGGMLGHKLFQYLQKCQRFQVIGTVRRNQEGYQSLITTPDAKIVGHIDASDWGHVNGFLQSMKPHIVINCIAMLAPKVIESTSPKYLEDLFAVNTLFPQQLAAWVTKTRHCRLILVSSDAVFGSKSLLEVDQSVGRRPLIEGVACTPIDAYGAAKALGEVSNTLRVVTLRVCIVGPELQILGGQPSSQPRSLLARSIAALSTPTAQVSASEEFVSAPIPTITLAMHVEDLILNHPNYFGVLHIGSVPISRYDWLCQIKSTFNLPGTVVKQNPPFVVWRALSSVLWQSMSGHAALTWDSLAIDLRSDYNDANLKNPKVTSRL